MAKSGIPPVIEGAVVHSPYAELLEKLPGGLRAEGSPSPRRGAAQPLMDALLEDVSTTPDGGPAPWCAAFDRLRALDRSPEGALTSDAWWWFLDDCITALRSQRSISEQGAYLVFHAARADPARYRVDLDDLEGRLADATSGPYVVWALAQCAESPRLNKDYEVAAKWLTQADAVLRTWSIERDGPDRRAGRVLLCLQRANLHLELGQHGESTRQAERAKALLGTVPVGGAGSARALRSGWIADQVDLTRASTLSAVGLHHGVLHALDAEFMDSTNATYRPYFQQLKAVALGRVGRTQESRALFDSLIGGNELMPLSHGLALLERVLLELDQGRYDAALELSLRASTFLDAQEDDKGLNSQRDRAQALQAYARWQSSRRPEDHHEAIQAARDAMDAMMEMERALSPSERVRGFLSYEPRRVVPALLVSLLLADRDPDAGRESALNALLELEQFGRLGQDMDAPVATVAEIRSALLGPDAGLIFYFPAWRSTHVFALSRARIIHSEIPSTAALIRHLGEARLSLSDPRCSPDDPALLEAAAAAFPKAVSDELATWSAVTFVGHGVLQNAPLAAFPVALKNRSARIPLGLALPTTELPSCSVGLALAARKVPGTKAIGNHLVIGNGVAQADLERLDLSAITFSPDRRALPLGTRFSEGPAASLRIRGERPVSLTLLAHGLLDPLRARPGGVLLPTSDGASGVFSTNIETAWPAGEAPPLVVLAACGVGQSPLRVGDDESGTLGAAFFRAGSSCCLASPVALEQDSTARLVTAFLTAFHSSDVPLSPSDALLAARRQLAAIPRFESPHYWAPLTPVGLGHQSMDAR